MILSTMTYEQIYREISHDFRDVLNYYEHTIKPKVCKSAQKSKLYPWRKFDFYIHPKSRNNYVYFSIVKKHSLWETPECTVFCDYEGKYGKEIITMAIWKDRITFRDTIIINIFQVHFFKRYFERFIKDERAENDKIMIFLARNSYAIQISSDAVSQNERLKDEPGYIDTALLNLDGLCLGKVSKENRNIIIYKTFIPFDELYAIQNEKVLPEYIRMLADMGCSDYPQCKETIFTMYNESAKKQRDILLGDNPMNREERFQAYLKEYTTTCRKLRKYIII